MGVVVLDVSVNEEGTPVDVKVVRSIPWVEVAAREAALKWRYEPTVVDGRPRPVSVRELVDMFPDLSTRARFWSDRVKNPGLDEPLRIEAAERLVVAGVKKKFVLEALGKAVRDPDPDISAAAASALRSLSTP
jgi:TonB family protein